MNVAFLDLIKNYTSNVNWREFACGWGSAFVNISVTYPIYKIIFRQMLEGVTVLTAVRELRTEGFHYLYRGMLPPLMQKTISLSTMFGVYDEVKRPLILHGYDPYVAKSIGGLIAGTLEATLMPFERVQTLLADSYYHKQFRNTFDAFQALTKYGIREYYRGFVPVLIRNGPSNVCFFIAREEVQQYLPQDVSFIYHNFNEFFVGAVIGAVTSSIIYPLNVIKVTMQSQIGGPHVGMMTVIRQIYDERGRKLSHFYKGVQINFVRAFISWGIINAAYENMKKLMY